MNFSKDYYQLGASGTANISAYVCVEQSEQGELVKRPVEVVQSVTRGLFDFFCGLRHLDGVPAKIRQEIFGTGMAFHLKYMNADVCNKLQTFIHTCPFIKILPNERCKVSGNRVFIIQRLDIAKAERHLIGIFQENMIRLRALGYKGSEILVVSQSASDAIDQAALELEEAAEEKLERAAEEKREALAKAAQRRQKSCCTLY